MLAGVHSILSVEVYPANVARIPRAHFTP